MNEKDMVKHIKELTKVIQNQNEYVESLTRNFTSINRIIANITARVSRLEGYKIRGDE